jgi:hypothetical protein
MGAPVGNGEKRIGWTYGTAPTSDHNCEWCRAYFHGRILWHSANEKAEKKRKQIRPSDWSSDIYSTSEEVAEKGLRN